MSEVRRLLLQKNKRIMFFMSLFVEIKALNAVATLFYLSRNLGLDQIFYLLVIWSVVGIILEVPSGYLADMIGRKKTIILGVGLHALSIAVLFVANSFPLFALFIALQSAAYAAFTGTDSALLYDSLRELGDVGSSLRVSGKYISSKRLAKIFIPLLGAIVAKDLLPWQFSVLIAVDFVGALISIWFAGKLTEPDRTVDLSEKESGIFLDSIKLFRSDSVARKLAINKSLVFIATLIFWRLYQPILKDLGISIIVLGIIYSLFQLLTFLSHWYFEKVEKVLGLRRIMNYPVLIGLVSILTFLLTKNLFVLTLATIFILIVGTFRDPIFFEQINLRVKSFNRATTTSVLNVVKSIFDIPLLLLTGFLIKFGYSYGVIIGAFLLVLTLIFFPVIKQDIITKND